MCQALSIILVVGVLLNPAIPLQASASKPDFQLQEPNLLPHTPLAGEFRQIDLTETSPVVSFSNPKKRDESSVGNTKHQPEFDYYDTDTSSAGAVSSNQHDSVFDPPLILKPHQRLPEKEYLSHYLAGKACRLDRGCQRKDKLNNTYLNYCTRYKLENLFSTEILMSIMHKSTEECERVLDDFIQLDELINQFNQMFKNLLTRYNCHNGYSVKWNCEDCKKAYADWLCATNLPYYMNGERIKPCISFCERVEQRCPYLHPITKEQYGGQPVFICRDPNIPFVPQITPDIPYSEPAKCYDLCHLSHTESELILDTLSKYARDKCPVESSIAEQVRSDLQYCAIDAAEQQQQPKVGQTKKIDKFYPNQIQQPDQYDVNTVAEYSIDENTPPTTISQNETNPLTGSNTGDQQPIHVHIKKLEELREVIRARERSSHETHWSTSSHRR